MFGFAHTEKEVFKNTFLNFVKLSLTYDNVCDFENKIAVLNKAFEDFPRSPLLNEICVNCKADNATEEHSFQISSKDTKVVLLLKKNIFNIHIDGNAYTSSEDMDVIVGHFSNFFQVLDIKEFKSVSVRKSDIISFSRKQGEKTIAGIMDLVFSKHFVGDRFSESTDSNRFMKEMVNREIYEDGTYRLVMNYGFNLTPPGKGKEEGDVILDMILEKNSSIPCLAIHEELKTIHQALYDVFRWTISDDIIKLMRK